MNMDEILNGARTAFINQFSSSSSDFRPKLLCNDKHSKVINSIRDELRDCDEFIISSAFITMGGITPLLEEFRNLEKNNVRGKILTTDYLTFTEPKALRKLNDFKNIEVKLYSQKHEGFHTKGYIFKKGDVFTGIVGSSNMTMNALTVNKEWNVEFTSMAEGEILSDLKVEFDALWDRADLLEDVLGEYEKIYDANRKFTNLRKLTEKIREDNVTLTPNYMQEQFLENIRTLLSHGEDKAILVSATGTGKTYASAFAVDDFKPERFLFLVHREQIAKQSVDAYKKVFVDDDKFGLLTGNRKDFEKPYLFSTIQTLSKEDVYHKFPKDYFDYSILP